MHLAMVDANLVWAVALFATPLLIAAVGELVVERAGVVNIGIEGMMLAGALGAWLGNAYLGRVAGVTAGVLAGVVLGVAFAIVVLGFAADQIVTGTGINLLALGVTGLVYRTFDQEVARRALSGMEPRGMMAVVALLVVGVWVFIRYTRAGLELVAIGEAPAAADTAGVPVGRRKLYAILFGSACAGLAGAYLSTMRVLGFNDNMTEGQGFLALAIVIFGRWNAWGIVLAGLFFGLVRAYADRLVVSGAYASDVSRLFNMLPYVVSLVALAGVMGKGQGPAGLGKAYVRE